MKNSELYFKTVDILVQSYFKGTLHQGNCYACAVGNIVAANIGEVFIPSYDMKIMWGKKETAWDNVFVTIRDSKIQSVYPGQYKDEAKEQIDATGYSWQELAQIEYAFETAPKGNSDDEWMFNGLMAVIDVLDIIHENTDAVVTSSTKQKFTHA